MPSGDQFFVDYTKGDDTNWGTQDAPFKTIDRWVDLHQGEAVGYGR
jgi:hypothetical protein